VTTCKYGFTDYGYGHGDLVSVEYSASDPASTPSVHYTYDRRGRRTTVQSLNPGQTTLDAITFTYDDANQPTAESHEVVKGSKRVQ
jgi:hypothetical protein